jgi:hypothetical protein
MSGRKYGLIAILVPLVAGLVLPGAADAAKPTAKLEFAVPAEGKVGFGHLVFTTKKKPKALSRKAAKRAKKGSKKLSKKIRAKAKLKGGQELSDDVQVAASIARVKGEKRTYALDVAVAHSRPGSAPRKSISGHAAGSLGGAAIAFGEVFAGRDPRRFRTGLIVDEQVAPNVTAQPPAPPTACGPDGDFANYGKSQAFDLNGDLLTNLEQLADFIAFAELMFCGEPIPDDLDELLNVLGLDPPPTCVPSLSPIGTAIGEFRVRMYCQIAMSRLVFEVPGQRQVQSFTPMQNLSNCQSGTNIQNGNGVLQCQGQSGAPLPRNTVDSVRIVPNRPLDPCDRVRIFGFTGPTAVVFNTGPFGECP